MSRPTVLHRGGTLFWSLKLYNSAGVLVDATGTPTVTVRKNGVATADAVTVTKRAATTGIYDCSYDPAGEIEGDEFTIAESAVISGITYVNSWQFTILATVADVQANLATASGVNAIPAAVWASGTRTLTSFGTLTTDTAAAVWSAGSRTLTSFGTLAPDLVEAIEGYLFGSGENLVTIEVLLASNPVPGALVRVIQGSETYLAQTGADGLAHFNLGAGEWSVVIASSLGTFAGTTLEVDGPESASYSLAANPSLAASDPDKLTGYWTCFSQAGVVEAGVTVTMQLVALPSGSTGLALDSAARVGTSGMDGVVSFSNLMLGCRYECVRGSGKKFYVTIPADADTTQALALESLIGT